jgi:hypothetical protein
MLLSPQDGEDSRTWGRFKGFATFFSSLVGRNLLVGCDDAADYLGQFGIAKTIRARGRKSKRYK